MSCVLNPQDLVRTRLSISETRVPPKSATSCPQDPSSEGSSLGQPTAAQLSDALSNAVWLVMGLAPFALIWWASEHVQACLPPFNVLEWIRCFG